MNSAAVKQTRQKVLVVEDEALLLFSIADDLTDVGFDVIDAVNADEALRKLAANPDISLLFTDIDMPGSMDGLGLCAWVHQERPDIKIVVTSGKAKPLDGHMPDKSQFLSKPYTTESVVAAFSKPDAAA